MKEFLSKDCDFGTLPGMVEDRDGGQSSYLPSKSLYSNGSLRAVNKAVVHQAENFMLHSHYHFGTSL